MADNGKLTGYKLPVSPEQQQGKVAQGFVTPKQDKTPQIQAIPPRNVLPIVFIPGIMGSNLRMSANRQEKLGAKNNIAWRPDKLKLTASQFNDSAKERQLRLDPDTTEVDIYDPVNNPTGDSKETSEQRNGDVHFTQVYTPFEHLDGPLLQSDYPSNKNPKSKDQKALERGWGEVYFSSYGTILSECEVRLNAAFASKSMDTYLMKFVAEISPTVWQATQTPSLKQIDEEAMRKTVKGCWLPVHAMGYNWLKGNMESGILIADRIRALIKKYQADGYRCEKVILLTHSMGGLVARAIIHPKMGKLNNEVLGIVHGVMPAMGAGTAYKRVRCGFEGSGLGAKILGQTGSHVTPVLANAQGGLELLPSQAYGNHWLQMRYNGETIKSLPEKSDPYEEIYKIKGKWFGLLQDDWINPADLQNRNFDRTCKLLDRAKSFHSEIANTYHDQSYAHYGADKNRKAWKNVVWNITGTAKINDLDSLKLTNDDAKGNFYLQDPAEITPKNKTTTQWKVELLDALEPGDQTVPAHSADAQFQSGKFKGIFRQTGYEHQASYSDQAAIACTIYSIFQIASTMTWPES